MLFIVQIISKKFEFQSNSNLQTIEKSAFESSNIQSIKMPCHLTYIGKSAFSNCFSIKTVEFEENSEHLTIDEKAFKYSGIEYIKTSSVAKIGEKVFDSCKHLSKVYISDFPNLWIIEKNAFTNSIIVFLKLPHHVIEIGELAFPDCCQLKTFENPTNSELLTIIEKAFLNVSIENF